MTYATRIAIGGILLLGAGCGGGGGSNNSQIDLASDPFSDGLATGGMGDAVGAVVVGDESGDVGVAGFYRFGLLALPAGVTVVRAVLNTYQYAVMGTPYADLGDLVVDSIDLDLGNGAGLDFGDYTSLAFSTVPGILSNDAAFGQRSIDVTAAVQADVAAGRVFSDFRVRFEVETDVDGAIDNVTLVSASVDGGTGHFPRLTVTYAP